MVTSLERLRKLKEKSGSDMSDCDDEYDPQFECEANQWYPDGIDVTQAAREAMGRETERTERAFLKGGGNGSLGFSNPLEAMSRRVEALVPAWKEYAAECLESESALLVGTDGLVAAASRVGILPDAATEEDLFFAVDPEGKATHPLVMRDVVAGAFMQALEHPGPSEGFELLGCHVAIEDGDPIDARVRVSRKSGRPEMSAAGLVPRFDRKGVVALAKACREHPKEFDCRLEPERTSFGPDASWKVREIDELGRTVASSGADQHGLYVVGEDWIWEAAHVKASRGEGVRRAATAPNAASLIAQAHVASPTPGAPGVASRTHASESISVSKEEAHMERRDDMSPTIAETLGGMAIPARYEQEEVEDPIVHAHMFSSTGWDWYLTEYDPESHEAFGYVRGLADEFGCFSVDEMDEVNRAHRRPGEPRVYFDHLFSPSPLSQAERLRGPTVDAAALIKSASRNGQVNGGAGRGAGSPAESPGGRQTSRGL